MPPYVSAPVLRELYFVRKTFIREKLKLPYGVVYFQWSVACYFSFFPAVRACVKEGQFKHFTGLFVYIYIYNYVAT